MAPNPEKILPHDGENLVFSKPVSDLIGDEVVISGISGIFPKSDNVEEFMFNLYNKVDMVTSHENTWPFIHPEMPTHSGKVNGFHLFDAQSLRVPYGQAEYMDPVTRKTMENVYCALFDAGVNPNTLAGTNLGVFVGSSFHEIINVNLYELYEKSSYLITGCTKTMQANRISYWLDGKGPSFSIDGSCSSTMMALEQAFQVIKSGRCDSAIVASSSQLMDPMLTFNLRRAGLLCLDGKTKCFDKNADGYVRSEAVSVFYIQRASDAKRIYAEISNIKQKYVMKPDINFLPIRQPDDIEEFLRQFYLEAGVSPNDVEYVEAYGAGLAKGDANELEAISRIFANGKSINVGCVKSNMGHSEAASDACAITKACLAYHKGELAGNLHYNASHDSVAAVRDGRIKVVTEKIPFKRGYTAFNSFAYSGTTYHALMKGHYKKKDLSIYKTSIPRLVLASGRTDEAVSKIFNVLKSNPVDAEQIALLHDFFSSDISGHTYRGYILLDTNEQEGTVTLSQNINHDASGAGPIWFVYSGMGSQWAGMGVELMKIPTFAASIERCRKVLLPKGIDIVKIITNKEKDAFDNILHSFVGITAMQIALTDLLKEMGIVPDNIIGHSVGEHGCAYADGCFTAEEIILVSYYRGLVSLETEFIDGTMAAVGLGYKQIVSLCPPDVEVACHNSSTSSTISGPTEIVKKFVENLKSQSIFAKAVQTSNIAYHSKYIAKAGPRFISTLSQIIKSPKLRSKKWLCTSAPPEKWDHEDIKYASAKYFTNNLLSSVYFEEAAQNIPEGSTLIEIAPHGLMQAILRRSHSTCINIPLTKQNEPAPINFFLQAIGKLYQAKHNPKIDILYPKVQYPVSTETPLLSHLIGWAYEGGWKLSLYKKPKAERKLSRAFAMTLNDNDWQYFEEHVRNGAIMFPESAFLVLVWETLAMQLGLHYTDISVKFENIRFEKELYLKKDDIIRFTIALQAGSSRFEIYDDNVQIVCGYVFHVKKEQHETILVNNEDFNYDVNLTAKEIYMLLGIKGYSYKDSFKTILSTNMRFNNATVKWTNNWVTLLDSLMQLNILKNNHDGVSVPKFITQLTINTARHKETEPIHVDDTTCLNATYDDFSTTTKCGGVLLKGIEFYNKPLVEKVSTIDQLKFVPHIYDDAISVNDALKINLQIVLENLNENNFNVVELITDSKPSTLGDDLKIILCETMPGIKVDINYIKNDPNNIKDIIQNVKCKSVHLLVINSAEVEKKILESKLFKSNNKTFVLSFVESNYLNETKDFKLITAIRLKMQKQMILRRYVPLPNAPLKCIMIDCEDDLSWKEIKKQLKKGEKNILVSQKYNSELICFVNKLKQENFADIQLIMVNDSSAESFSTQSPFYQEQIQKDLMFNTFNKNNWGGYYYLPVEKPNTENVNIALKNKSGNDWTWVEKPVNTHDNDLIQVSYAGPSLYDYQNATGKIGCSNSYGMDFSGYNFRGEKVMGLVPCGALASMVQADPILVWPVPQGWSMQDAASVPLHYAMAYYCLFIKGSLEENETVLVIGGAGALGQAVISLCLASNCSVYTTVSSKEKKQFLLTAFPKLKEECVLCTSDPTSFRALISLHTENLLCNYVISCATGEMRKEAMKCVANFGEFMNINNHDELENLEFGMYYCCAGRSYKSVKLSSIFEPENISQKKFLHQLLANGIAQGTVKPITNIVYPPSEVSTAFESLISKTHTGRILIKMEDTTDRQDLKVMTCVSFQPKSSYLVTGCESQIGVELADWLVKRGARNIILHQKNNSLDTYIQVRRELWKKDGVISTLYTSSLQKYEECDGLLCKCENLGPLNGIFILHETEHSNLLVSHLDKASKNKCRQLSNFVIITGSKHIACDDLETPTLEHICEVRNMNQLPGLILHCHAIDEENQDSLSLRLSQLYNALENCIRYNYNNVITRYSTKHDNNDFLLQVSRIFGTLNNTVIEENKSLRSLNINELCLDEIRNLINRTFEIDYSKEELQQFTFARFKNMNSEHDKKANKKKGLRAFYNFVEDDEIQATEPIVKMPSKVASCSTLTENELDSKETHLIMIPGFEGHSRIFASVGEMLKIRAVTLQLSPDLQGDSIQEMAQVLFKEIQKTFKFQSKFYLLGYSFGVNIALELAALLEKEGHIGVVYCLDSSPDAVRINLKAYLGEMSETKLQDLIITEFYELTTGKSSEALKEELKKDIGWSEKIEITLQKIKKRVSFSHDYLRAILETIYKRIKFAEQYQPDIKLQSEIVLMRGNPHPQAENLTDDYNLSKYSKKPVRVFQIQSDHISAPKYSAISSIVNKMLEPELLEKYNRMNLCEVTFEN